MPAHAMQRQVVFKTLFLKCGTGVVQGPGLRPVGLGRPESMHTDRRVIRAVSGARRGEPRHSGSDSRATMWRRHKIDRVRLSRSTI